MSFLDTCKRIVTDPHPERDESHAATRLYHPELPLQPDLPPAQDTLAQKFAAYHDAHPMVWLNFYALVMERIKDGEKYISPRDLAPEVRRLVGHGVNNSYWRFYADKFKAARPEYAHLFRERHRPVKAMKLVYAR